MNIYHPTIKTIADIATWVQWLAEADMLFDVSLPARSVVRLSNGQPMWTDVEADLIDATVNRCLDLTVGTNFDLGAMVAARATARATTKRINDEANANWDNPEWRRQKAAEAAEAVFHFPHFDPGGPKPTAQVYVIVADKDNGAGGGVFAWSRSKDEAGTLMAQAVATDGDEYVLSFVRYELDDGDDGQIARQLLEMHSSLIFPVLSGTPVCVCGQARWDVDSDVTNRVMVQVNDDRPAVLVDRAGPEDSTKFAPDANVHCSACGADPGEAAKSQIVSAAAKIVNDRAGRWEILNSYTDL